MLSDPLVIGAFTTTPPTFASSTAINFRKVANGKATAIEAPYSADQPAYISVKQRPASTPRGAKSDFTVRYEQHFNVTPINGVPQADIPLVVECRIISYPQFHSLANLRGGHNVASAVVSTFMDRLQGGEGI